ncbi:MAG: Ppx/GppA family phosphatase, partial [Campylobacteraceae bacterium]|nr:Ppx/GppA family phosphatase [Campylobacteraceae bacterium]
NFLCKKILCVATSALRDAPNSKELVRDIKKRFRFDIKIIDGNQEATYGAIAVNNMVSGFNETTTIDIGGGSTELAKIKNGIITKTTSLDIGTVRLKELFFDKKAPKDKIINFIDKELKKVDEEFFSQTVVGIGGTIRTLSKLFIEKSQYPINTIHNYEYNVGDFLPLIKQISSAKVLDLKDIGIKKDRLDTIREGAVIFEALLDKLCAKKVITSGVGVREGLYLSDILRSSHNRFPANFYLSLESLKERFTKKDKVSPFIAKCALELFDTLSSIHQLDEAYKFELQTACKLHSIGRYLNFYQENIHSGYFVLNSLNYGFTHKQKLLISIIMIYNNKKITENDIKKYKELLPNIDIINWLIFLFSLSKILYIKENPINIKSEYKNHTLCISSNSTLYLAKDLIKKLPKPSSFAIKIEQI